ncbi:MAG: LCP family protein [Candidatus Cellulosilyticum pullistercoris]|uniref:LCP family protein n=1 Tax=Candidatus Cellulosilyticum pullistercoris TaxID=2838521 RepID=A0A9E2KCR2_9FIRM|nr:LCP family protein [Candidatus Cellulosilyticum pullistercoris]
MEQEQKRLNGKQKKKLLKTFFLSAGVTLGLCIFILIAGVLVYDNTLGAGSTSQIKNALTEEEQAFEDEKKELGDLNKTVAILGVDEDEIRTDVIFVVNFNTMTNKVKVVSIPRDTKVIWTDKQKRAYNQLTGYTQNISKLNEMSAYGRINQNVGNIRDFTIDEIENILRVHIDNYVVVNLDAFKEIVDAIGGVDMYVPQDMYYVDNSQGLYINLKEGQQHLDAEDAEGLVRFRRYALGDEARVEVQQTFLKAVAEKVMSAEMRSNLPNIITRLFPYVKTDIKLTEVLGYLGILDEFSLSGLEFHIVPGYGDDSEGPSYYYINEEELDELIKDVFYDTTVAGEEVQEEAGVNEEEEIVTDKSVTIAIYNATGQRGLAGAFKNNLENLGYKVGKIDNYNEKDLEDSTIYAKDMSKAKQFLQYVEGADIKQDSSLEYDIEIIIGKESVK